MQGFHQKCLRDIEGVLDNERGITLVIVLLMLVILGILGASLLSTTTTDVQIAGNARNNEQAFYVTEAALQYAETNSDIYKAINPGVQDTYSSSMTVNGQTAKVVVKYTGASPPPSGYDATEFQSNLYTISATGAGPNNAQASLVSGVARIVPKAKDY